MDKINFLHFLREKNQIQLIDHLSTFSEKEEKGLSAKLFQDLQENYLILDLPKEKIYDLDKMVPLSSQYIHEPSNLSYQPKVHVILLAAGQGTRLGIGPKALLPFHETSLIGHHLNELFKLKLTFVIHILLSKEQGSLIEEHLKENDYFDHSKENIFFCYQKDAFFLDKDLSLRFRSQKDLAKGPAGNGEVFHAMKDKLDHIQLDDIVFILPIDNPIGLKALPSLLNAMQEKNSDLSLAVFEKKNPIESLGVVIEYNNIPIIIDYPFLPAQLSLENKALFANTNLFCIKGDLFQLLAQQELPFHTVVKQVDVYEKGEISKESLYRFERFITDIVPFSKNPSFILLERELIYSAIKDKNSYEATLSLKKFPLS